MDKGRPGQSPSSYDYARLRARYDQLWSSAVGKIRSGNVDCDPVLQAGIPDERRGLTVIARPSPMVRRHVAAFLRQLRALEPEQHYYASTELHVTVLSLFTATTNHGPFFAQRDRYISAVDAALRGAAPIGIEFTGVTATAGTIMIQGFFENAALNDLRGALRSQLRIRGLGGGLDRRYILETAHMTVVRFRAPLCQSKRFAALLEEARERPFGSARIRTLGLVSNDWYMSRRATKVVKRYRLTGDESLR